MTKIQKIARCSNVSSCPFNPLGYKNVVGSSYFTPSNKVVGEYALKRLEEAWEKDQAIHQGNLEALENNKKLREEITSFMKDIGIPDTYYAPDPKSRARIPKQILYRAGYIQDMDRNIVVSDGFSETNYKTKKEAYTKFLTDALKEEQDKKLASQKEIEARDKQKKENFKLASIIIRYGLDELSEWEDVREHLLSKNRLLNLAMAMMNTRMDWNDGPRRVRHALFEPQTDLEKEIVDNVSQHVYDWDGDGRIFRDCKWNYDRIFSVIEDQQLVKDALLANEKMEEF